MLISSQVLDKIEIVRGQLIYAVRAAKLAEPLAIALRQKINKAIDLTVDDALKSDEISRSEPSDPPVAIVPGGSLTVSYGTITILSSDVLSWSNGSTTTAKGSLVEAFVKNDVVYVMGTDNNYYQHDGSFTGDYTQIIQLRYEILRASVLKIITSAPDPVLSAG